MLPGKGFTIATVGASLVTVTTARRGREDAWHGWAHEDRYGRLKPVVRALQGTVDVPTAAQKVRAAQGLLDEALVWLG